MSTRTSNHGAADAFSLTATGQSWAQRLFALYPLLAKQMQWSRTRASAQGINGCTAEAHVGTRMPTEQDEVTAPPNYGLVLELRGRYLPSLFVRRIDLWGGLPFVTVSVSREGLFFGLKPWELAVIWPGVQP